jgi:hypothetical protein
MRHLTIALLAAAGIAAAIPASAEDLYVGGRAGGVGVDIDSGYHRDRVVEHRVYRDRDDFGRGHCRTVIIHRDGIVKKIRRCY